ncbi:hypothetical protein BDB01DRAFT_777469 [Pilobolus umbonatus]|nr:hypothetical protein BDB01DRAFT_777469 [Pilobolus umbonatus]
MHIYSVYILSLLLLLTDAHIKRADEIASPPSTPQSIQTLPEPSPTVIATAVVTNSPSEMSMNDTKPAQPTPVDNDNPFVGKPTYASFSNDIPPAYLTWKKPIPNQTFPPLYKIGVSNISFEWTVDPAVLKVQPANITVALANPQKQTFTAAIVAGTATSAHWDLAHVHPASPLMVGYYTVWVYDQRGPKAFPSPGWLMPDSRLVVAMYSTEAYVGRTDSMFCPTCFLGTGQSFHESVVPFMIAFCIALVTSGVMLVSILN